MKKTVPPLIPVLIAVSMIFIGILVFAYVVTKRANPQMIEVGNVHAVHTVRPRLG